MIFLVFDGAYRLLHVFASALTFIRDTVDVQTVELQELLHTLNECRYTLSATVNKCSVTLTGTWMLVSYELI